jgi:hypothetical protein
MEFRLSSSSHASNSQSCLVCLADRSNGGRRTALGRQCTSLVVVGFTDFGSVSNGLKSIAEPGRVRPAKETSRTDKRENLEDVRHERSALRQILLERLAGRPPIETLQFGGARALDACALPSRGGGP